MSPTVCHDTGRETFSCVLVHICKVRQSPLDPIRSVPYSGNFRVFHDIYHRGTYRTCELIPSIHHELGKRRVLSVTCGKS